MKRRRPMARWLEAVFEFVQGFSLIGIVLFILSTIVLRNVFGFGLVWVFEATGVLMVYLVFLGAPRNLLDNTEIRVDVVNQMMPLGLRKVFWIAQKLLILTVSVVICAAFFRHMQGFGQLGTPILGIPKTVEFAAVFIGPLMAAVVTVWHLVLFVKGEISDGWF